MKENLACAAVFAVLALCLLGGCATDPQASNGSDSSPVEQAAPVAHGEASIQYGHGAGN